MEGGRNTNPHPPKEWREARRMRAWERHDMGWQHTDLARALGVTEGAVSQWLTKGRTPGRHALRQQSPPGAHSTVTPTQRAPVPTEVAKGAEAFGCRGAVWTTARVAHLIPMVFGVRAHPAHGRRLLRPVKHARHQPIHKASQRDETAMATWKAERWPALQKRLKRKSARAWVSIRPPFPWCQWRYAPLRPEARHRSSPSRGPVTIVRLWAA